MTNQNLSVNEISDKIMQRTKKIIKKEKLKPEKELQDRQYKLDLKLQKKTSKLAIIAIIISTLSFLFSIFTFYGNKVSTLSIVAPIEKQQTTTNTNHSNAHD